METVGVIGLGRLGSAVAGRLMAAGFKVLGYDIDEERRNWLADAGGQTATPFEIALRCRRIVVSIRVHDEVLALAPIARAGTIVIDSTTATPEQSSSAAAHFRERGIAYLDAPCCDWHETVRERGGKFVCGGDRSAFAACREVLGAFANPAVYAGESGAGSRMKLELEKDSK